ncbi:MAG: M42 family metallopeptidase [Mycoplasmatales bacterium]
MDKKIIKELTNINGISAYEKDVREYFITQIKDYVDSYEIDPLGNVITKISGSKQGKSIAIVAHMDEVGFLVKRIADDGLINIICIGGVDLHTINNCQVTVNGFDGVILLKPINDEKVIEIKNFVVDLGFASKEQVTENGIKIGDMINFKNNFLSLQNNNIASKALDDRLGIAALINLAKKINNNLEYGCVYLCASVQEEVGLRGATTITSSFPCELKDVLVIDVSPISDYYCTESCKLGNGALLRVQDPGMIFNHDIIDQFRKLSSDNEIKVQEFFSLGGTDSRAIEISKEGYSVGALCVPARCLHATNTIANLDDYLAMCDLSYLYIKEVTRG